jgi:hypothetical protein
MDMLSSKLDRRRLVLAGLGTVAGGLLIGCGGSAGLSHTTTSTSTTGGTTSGDGDYLNFALNLEYLMAEYYLRALTGQGLADGDIGTNPGTVNGGAAVAFSTPLLRTVAQEIATEEQLHVRVLRSTLGAAAVPRPTIDFTNAFAAIGVATSIPSFNPFADEDSFLVGAFLFEDLAVTAYSGLLASLTDSADITEAVGIMGAECYHAGAVRKTIYDLGGATQTNSGRISTWRAGLGNGKDQQVSNGILANVSATDSTTGFVFSRTTREVLNVLYLTANVSAGGFFPNGMNGTIK